jgi:hypothetical protein
LADLNIHWYSLCFLPRTPSIIQTSAFLCAMHSYIERKLLPRKTGKRLNKCVPVTTAGCGWRNGLQYGG